MTAAGATSLYQISRAGHAGYSEIHSIQAYVLLNRSGQYTYLVVLHKCENQVNCATSPPTGNHAEVSVEIHERAHNTGHGHNLIDRRSLRRI